MIFASVCDGIGAAACAWVPLGWQFAFKSEIEAFPNSVSQRHYQTVPNYGDMTQHHEWPATNIDVLVGGTPCQSFSVAGLRKGLADPRGNLTLTFLGIVEQYRPRWVVWENVPGVLSDNTGAFGAFLGGLGKLGYGFAYRILDAQYFGVAQRRRRVFVVAHSGGQWQRAAAVLFERESLCGDTAPSRPAGKGFTYELAPSLGASGRGVERAGETRGQDPVVGVPIGIDGGELAFARSANASHSGDKGDGGVVAIPEVCGCLSDGAHNGGGSTAKTPTPEESSLPEVAWAIQERDAKGADSSTKAGHLIPTHGGFFSSSKMAVRRLTPRECERLQGFPEDYTLVPHRGKPAADGPRYKALGNSMAVPVMRWIGQRIAFVDAL